jgi:hypothetical protein
MDTGTLSSDAAAGTAALAYIRRSERQPETTDRLRWHRRTGTGIGIIPYKLAVSASATNFFHFFQKFHLTFWP